jgi:hypothetical protein
LTVRSNLLRVIWPDSPDFMKIAQDWSNSASLQLLRYVWMGCDSLDRNRLRQVQEKIDNLLNLERSVTQLLWPEINRAMPKASPFFVMHECYEFESQRPAVPNAQPPQYDIAFVLYSNHRIMWPIEAKVLSTDASLSEYVEEIMENFLTCRYAPFVVQGAMLGYLLKGVPSKFYNKLSEQLDCPLVQHADFPERNHRTSDHQRSVPPGKPYPAQFKCHHLVFEIGSATDESRLRVEKSNEL